jgi:hypothetical protein
LSALADAEPAGAFATALAPMYIEAPVPAFEKMSAATLPAPYAVAAW